MIWFSWDFVRDPVWLWWVVDTGLRQNTCLHSGLLQKPQAPMRFQGCLLKFKAWRRMFPQFLLRLKNWRWQVVHGKPDDWSNFLLSCAGSPISFSIDSVYYRARVSLTAIHRPLWFTSPPVEWSIAPIMKKTTRLRGLRVFSILDHSATVQLVSPMRL